MPSATDQNLIFIQVIYSLLVVGLTKRLSHTKILLYMVHLPSTILHELMHYAVGLLLFARPGMPSIIPRKTMHGYQLGSVVLYNSNSFNAFPTGTAPFWLSSVALVYGFHQSYINQPDTFLMLITPYLLMSMPLSKADLSVALKYPATAFAYIMGALLLIGKWEIIILWIKIIIHHASQL